jgi:CBS-domain-containing membrane protein
MTRDVVTIAPSTTIQDIASLLVAKRISAVPVISDGNDVIGIVTESDLLHREEIHTEHKRKWWLETFVGADTQAREFVKTHGLRAEQVMSRVVTAVSPDTDLAEVADILDAHKIRRVPVTDKGKLVGIISRADIVRALAQAKVPIPVASMENGALQKTIKDEIKKQPWIDDVYLNALVSNGVVELMGFVDTAEQHTALRVLVEGVPGVKEVVDHIRLRKWEVSA